METGDDARVKLKAKRKLEKTPTKNDNVEHGISQSVDEHDAKSQSNGCEGNKEESSNIDMNSLSITDEQTGNESDEAEQVLLLDFTALQNLPDIENEDDFSFKEFYSLYKNALQQLASITEEQYKSSIKKDRQIKVLADEVKHLRNEVDNLKQWQSIAYSEIQKANVSFQYFSTYISSFQNATADNTKHVKSKEKVTNKKQVKTSEPVFYGDSSCSKKLANRKKYRSKQKQVKEEIPTSAVETNEIEVDAKVSIIKDTPSDIVIDTVASGNDVSTDNLVEEVQPTSEQSIEDLLRETAESVVSNSGLAYDETSGLYYDWNLKMYYDPSTKLYYDHENGVYYYYDAEKNSYIFHSQIDVANQQVEKNDSQLKAEELSDGEIESDKSDSDEMIDPCIRIIIVQSESLDIGNLFIVTVNGGSLGSSKDNLISIPSKEISPLHANILYDKDDKTFFIEDKSTSGIYINNEHFQNNGNEHSEPIELSHRDFIKVGDTTCSFHIHLGLKTCNDCEPGNIKAIVANNEKEKEQEMLLSQKDLNSQRKTVMKNMRKKYNITPGYIPDKLISSIPDRAGQRRIEVGSEPYANKDKPVQKASVHKEIPTSNIGHKMLAKMGWKSGEGLGKEGGGIVNPVTVDVLQNKKGLGAGAKASIDNHAPSRNQVKWDKARERFNKL